MSSVVRGSPHHTLPFEYAAIECLISAAFDHLNRDITYVEAQFDAIHSKAQKKLSPSSILLEDLHSVKDPIAAYEDRVAAFDKVFNELLSNPQDLSRMALTRLFYDDCLYDTVPSATAVKHEEPDADLEILLEYFDQEMDQFTERVRHMREMVGNTERLISLRLALMRNRLIYWELAASVLATGISVGTCVSGIFGMNMTSGLEDSNKAFVVTTICVAVVCFLSLLAVGYVLFSVRL